MKVETRDNRAARKVLTGLIVSTPVVAAVSAKWDKGGLFGSRYENLVAGWCVRHYRKYGKAPDREIESVFDRWATDGKEPETVKLIESLLTGLSGQYESRRKKINPEYTIDLAGEFFTEVRLRALKDQLEARLQDGQVKECLEDLRSFREVEVGGKVGIDPLGERELIVNAFKAKGKPLFSWGDNSLDRFFQSVAYRDEFLCFVGRAKVGKSWWLQETVIRAAKSGLNVAFFEVGDQTQNQILRRIGSRMAGRPVEAQKNVKVPTALDIQEGQKKNRAVVTHEVKSWDDRLKGGDAAKACEEFDRNGLIRLSVHPNGTLTVAQIDSILSDWELDGWTPDVCVIDYFDLLAPSNSKDQLRDQINRTWADLRGLNQKWHCLLVGATQANRDSYTESKTLTMNNFSDARQKNDHVTAMVGINQTAPEKRDGVYRLNMIHGRDLDFASNAVLYCAGCLAIGNPCMFASF